ncbi:hypothetical protein GCM10010919_28340 [Alishewanella longhuensis]|uniref:Uncharacterized protein n=1 Tax=Alishewanella longhuensis TaxID=1091037 RepID=A0ABQ3L144_9ALTE|nr:hypothetical protein GCM10010919_28340 [Alishewanella longhuensis]
MDKRAASSIEQINDTEIDSTTKVIKRLIQVDYNTPYYQGIISINESVADNREVKSKKC